MREILFRGRKTNGEWTFGNLQIIGDCYFISVEMGYNELVDTETVGQYTGLTDKNGKKIFEGDILKDVSDVGNEQLYEVYYNADLCAFMLDDQYWITPTRDWLSKDDKNPTTMMLQIVGNIHDNPEMMKGGAE